MTVRQDSQASNKNRLPLQNKVLGNNRSVSTIRRREKKKHRNLKQIFVLSLDALRERKGRSALTMLMVVVGGALMVAINGMSAGSAVFMNKQLVSLAPNVIFVSPGSKSKTFQEAPGLATQAPRLPFNAEVANMIKSLPYASSGSGSPIAYGVLESVYNKEITNEQAKQIATKAVAAAMERDPGSGNGIDVLVIPNLVVVKEEK